MHAKYECCQECVQSLSKVSILLGLRNKALRWTRGTVVRFESLLRIVIVWLVTANGTYQVTFDP